MSNPTQNTEEILGKLAEVFSPKPKEKKEKKDRVISIDGAVCSDVVTMKEAEKIAKRLASTDSVVKVYKLEGTLSTNLDVSIAAVDAPDAGADAETEDSEGAE